MRRAQAGGVAGRQGGPEAAGERLHALWMRQAPLSAGAAAGAVASTGGGSTAETSREERGAGLSAQGRTVPSPD